MDKIEVHRMISESFKKAMFSIHKSQETNPLIKTGK